MSMACFPFGSKRGRTYSLFGKAGKKRQWILIGCNDVFVNHYQDADLSCISGAIFQEEIPCTLHLGSEKSSTLLTHLEPSNSRPPGRKVAVLFNLSRRVKSSIDSRVFGTALSIHPTKPKTMPGDAVHDLIPWYKQSSGVPSLTLSTSDEMRTSIYAMLQLKEMLPNARYTPVTWEDARSIFSSAANDDDAV
ncbi:hypothetical protein CPB85DRAFT_1332749, partial [Mucidula mucida]